MGFELLDYSYLFYTELNRQSVAEKRGGKFVQIRCSKDETEFLVLSPLALTPYHAGIVERFFSARGVSGAYNAKHDYYRIDSHEWEILGGGLWDLDSTARSLSLSGISQAYGPFEPAGLKEKINATGLFSGFRLFVNGH